MISQVELKHHLDDKHDKQINSGWILIKREYMGCTKEEQITDDLFKIMIGMAELAGIDGNFKPTSGKRSPIKPCVTNRSSHSIGIKGKKKIAKKSSSASALFCQTQN